MTEANEELTEVRRRILADFQVQRGSEVWAPWGKSGWSAVVIRKPLRKKADGMRVKPKTGEEVAKGKVPKDRLVRRDSALKGKDRPGFTPEEVFAHLPEKAKPRPKPAEEAPVVEDPKPAKPRSSAPTDWRAVWVSHYTSYHGMSRKDAEAAYDSCDDDW